jgi:hypothetical protein
MGVIRHISTEAINGLVIYFKDTKGCLPRFIENLRRKVLNLALLQ